MSGPIRKGGGRNRGEPRPTPQTQAERKAVLREVQESGGKLRLFIDGYGNSHAEPYTADQKRRDQKLLARRAQLEREYQQKAFETARLLDFRSQMEPSPVSFQTENLAVGIRTLRGPDFAEMGVWMASAGYSLTDFIDTDAQALFNAALLLVGLSDATGSARFFGSLLEVEVFQGEPGAVPVMQSLRGALLGHNAALLPSQTSRGPKSPDRRDGWEKRLVRAFSHNAPSMPDDALGLVMFGAYWAGPVAQRLGLFDQWQRQDVKAARAIAESLLLTVATIERQTQHTAQTIVTELIKRTQKRQ